MANTRLPMRKIKDILRLNDIGGVSFRDIARSCGVSRRTVGEYVRRAQTAGLTWTEAQGLNEGEIETRLFPPDPAAAPARPLPDFATIYEELRSHKDVNLTLSQLWIEYKKDHPDAYQYTQFCEHYRAWRKTRDYCLRQEHRAGEKAFVDFGKGLKLVDPATGQQIPTEIFVTVWGHSNFTYAEATLAQDLSSWIGAHVRAFEYFGAVPRVLVPDNLKSGVSKACLYEPEINPTYAHLAQHYGTVVIPARRRKPRDKAKVEAGVLITKRWILAVLRHRTFFSIEEMNAAIWEFLEQLNNRLLRKIKRSRRDIFESAEKPVALPLPKERFEYADWMRKRVHIDSHVEVLGHYYSVPYPLRQDIVDIRITAATVEVFHKGERVAAHPRSFQQHRHTTLSEHLPPEHRKYREWTPSRFLSWAGKIGPDTAALVEAILSSRAFPEQGYRSCLGVLRLGKHYSPERLEAACRRALRFNAVSFRSVRTILARGLDKTEEAPTPPPPRPRHENIRGESYYN